MEMDTSKIDDPDFEPQPRMRSNTWPLRPAIFDTGEKENISGSGDVASSNLEPVSEERDVVSSDINTIKSKATSRRNAWGNLSYADLITKAIQTSPDQRLTLSQIYDWMVQNVPYFKDKGESNSSAGWKNSIRHNLSLHNRFMRMQNEGAGKSSWWVINPDAKAGKNPRRRATSMDTKAYEKKRGRAKKKVNELRAAMEGTSSPNSAISEAYSETDLLTESTLHGFQLSPEFRPRANSNASSCGRLSPLPGFEPDLHDNQVPPMSPVMWNEKGSLGNLSNSTFSSQSNTRSMETLGDNLDVMKLGNGLGEGGLLTDLLNSPLTSSQQQQLLGQGNGLTSFTNLGAPPPYPDAGQISPGSRQQQTDNSKLSPISPSANVINSSQMNFRKQSALEELLSAPNTPQTYSQDPIMGQDPMMSSGATGPTNNSRGIQFSSANNMTACGGQMIATNVRPESILRTALTQQQMARLEPELVTSVPLQEFSQNAPMDQKMDTTMVQNPIFPNDLDLIDSIQAGITCDVNEVLRQTINMDGSLDFNFDGSSTPLGSAGKL